MPFKQTVTVVNKSGKIVTTSKTLAGVWKDAKTAYLDKKADIKAGRKTDADVREARRAQDRLDADDRDRDAGRRRRSRDYVSPQSADSSRAQSPSSPSAARRKPVATRPRPDRRDTDASGRSPHQDGRPNIRFENGLAVPEIESRGKELVLARRNTDGALHESHSAGRPRSVRSSLNDSEMESDTDELPPALPARPVNLEVELRQKVSKLQQLLDEANCVGHSATFMIESLSKNPDQLAAVGLTLAEISKLAVKMAPSALTSIKAIFPAVFALLAAPEFMIAAGVGVGVTVIALGGYKIIKRYKKKKAARIAEGERAAMIEDEEDDEDEDEDEELQEVRSNLSSIEVWRQGLVEAQLEAGTVVEGEFITPTASKQLIEAGEMKRSDLKPAAHKPGTAKARGKADRKRREKDEQQRATKENHKLTAQPNDESVLDKGKALIRNPASVKNLFSRSASTTKDKELSLA